MVFLVRKASTKSIYQIMTIATIVARRSRCVFLNDVVGWGGEVLKIFFILGIFQYLGFFFLQLKHSYCTKMRAKRRKERERERPYLTITDSV